MTGWQAYVSTGRGAERCDLMRAAMVVLRLIKRGTMR